MDQEKDCVNCKHTDCPFEEYPCINCKNTSIPYSKEYNFKPFMWEPCDESEDAVNHPHHYETGKFECIDVMAEAIGVEDTKGFCLCNAFKYIYRCTKKHETPTEDVKKAIWYLNKFLELESE